VSKFGRSAQKSFGSLRKMALAGILLVARCAHHPAWHVARRIWNLRRAEVLTPQVGFARSAKSAQPLAMYCPGLNLRHPPPCVASIKLASSLLRALVYVPCANRGRRSIRKICGGGLYAMPALGRFDHSRFSSSPPPGRSPWAEAPRRL